MSRESIPRRAPKRCACFSRATISSPAFAARPSERVENEARIIARQYNSPWLLKVEHHIHFACGRVLLKEVPDFFVVNRKALKCALYSAFQKFFVKLLVKEGAGRDFPRRSNPLLAFIGESSEHKIAHAILGTFGNRDRVGNAR